MRTLAATVVVLLLLPVALTALYAILPPLGTPLMIIRAIEGDGAQRRWTSIEDMPPALPRMLLAGEDSRFCGHHGFDWTEIQNAYETWRGGGRLRGASTISMQVTRNLYLWPGGGWFRKGLEALWTPAVELILDKRRIVELYLNIAEMGPGVFGVEAAARHWFGRDVGSLTSAQAARLIAILPNPREWSASAGGYVSTRAGTIAARARALGTGADCLKG